MTIADSGSMMDNESLCLPCTPEDELSIVKDLNQKAESCLKEGNLYFVISNRWFTKWQKYVGEETGKFQFEEIPIDKHASPLKRAVERPEPIDNTDIIDKTRQGLLSISAVSKKLSTTGETDQEFYGVVNESFTLQQRTRLVGSLQAGTIIANALLLTTPLEALAEICEVQPSMFNMNMPLLVALIGATVGGLLARQRKAELLRLNEQLRQINAALKRQAKIESYAPALSYAPAAARVPENEVIVDPKKQELISHLKNGKNFLRNQNPDKAFFEFKTALELAQNIKDPIEEKKAARGLGASLQRQGKHREAIKYHSMVLSISEREGEDSGNTEAFGAIADCYTELGDLERAATFYDQYIARLQAD